MSTDVNLMLDEVAGLPDFVPAKPALQKLNYSHKCMIDMLITEMPPPNQNELARRFGRTASWISIVMASDAFRVKLAERQEAIVDPILRERVKEQLDAVLDEKAQLTALMMRSMEVLRAKLEAPLSVVPDQLALRTLELTSRANGYGARDTTTVNVNVNQQIDDASGQLVHLLRRKKAEVLDADFEPSSDAT